MKSHARYLIASLLALVLTGCATPTLTNSIKAVPVTCPNFSGTYRYPGITGLDAICTTRWEAREDMPLPADGGFYLSAKAPHTFEIVQTECRQLTMRFFVQSGPDIPKSHTLLLTPEDRARHVRWSEEGLWYKQKFVPAGFRLPKQKNWMELELILQPDESLRYHLIQRESRNSKPKGEIDCLWTRAD